MIFFLSWPSVWWNWMYQQSCQSCNVSIFATWFPWGWLLSTLALLIYSFCHNFAGCGLKLRGDDPAAMRDFIFSVQQRVLELKSPPERASNGQPVMNSKRVSFVRNFWMFVHLIYTNCEHILGTVHHFHLLADRIYAGDHMWYQEQQKEAKRRFSASR